MSFSNVGHTIQKMINNTPISVTVNDKTTTVVTNGGSVYQTGFYNGRAHNSFSEIITNENLVGRVLDAQATEDSIYLLNAAGSVFQYNFILDDCSGPILREVYSPAACGQGDNAIKITAGRAHLLILTKSGKVWGVGDNSQYQLVPQGQCRYDTATEIIITDTNLHDNNCCSTFVGTYNELECPVIPRCEPECNNIACVKKNLCDVFLGYFNISKVTLTSACGSKKSYGTLSVPVYGDLNYVGFLCVDKDGCVTGSVTYSITRIFIKCGCLLAKFTTSDSCGNCKVRDLNVSSTCEILIFEASLCHNNKTDLCVQNLNLPITGTGQINGKCGACVVVNIDLPCDLALPNVNADPQCSTILLDLHHCKTSLTVLCDGAFSCLEYDNVDIGLDFDVPLDCCEPVKRVKTQIELPQPCWTSIYAGSDTSVLVDNCNRLYVLGSIHQIRSNKDLLKKSCLEELLGKTSASISFPADQLNCGGNTTHRNNRCPCPKCADAEFKTDLTKFGIHLNFPNGECEKQMNVCDFLSKLKRCNEAQSCEPTCEPCDSYIYLNISGDCGCPCGAPSSAPIGSITLFNKRSICKLVSQGCPDLACLPADVNTIVEYDLNKYCIDTTDVSLDKIVKLDFCVEGPNVNVYIDLDRPGGIKLTSNGKKCNVEFTVSASTQTHQYILNYGSILDPVELTNLKYALSLDCYFPCPKFKNPFDTKITNTYLRGGDHVRFVTSNPKNIRQAITADIPTVFRLNRRVIDVGVGYNNLSVLVGGLACPNEIFAIGANCHGELGIGSNETVVCFKQINRCIFDCQVNSIFSGKNVTFYITQSHNVYATGQWKCFVNSTTPVPVKSICKTWKIKSIDIAKNHIIFASSDGCIFGLGDNSVGELGLYNLDAVTKPTPLTFFYKLTSNVAKQLKDNLTHPVEANYNNRKNNHNNQNNQNNFGYPKQGQGYGQGQNQGFDNNYGPKQGFDGYDNCACGPCGKFKNPCRFPKKYFPNNRVYNNKANNKY